MPVDVISNEPVFVRKTVCEKCAYALAYTGIDVEYHSFGINDGGYYFINCPREECKQSVRVPCWELPDKLKEQYQKS